MLVNYEMQRATERNPFALDVFSKELPIVSVQGMERWWWTARAE